MAPESREPIDATQDDCKKYCRDLAKIISIASQPDDEWQEGERPRVFCPVYRVPCPVLIDYVIEPDEIEE